MTSQIIVIAEDEPKLAQLLSDYLEQSGFDTHCIADGLEVIPWIKDNLPALMLLDLMLPGKNGLDICKEVRLFSALPIIMVTARIEEIDRLLGLELGADDYICKPFSPREVVARVKTVLRRTQTPPSSDSQELVLDESRYLAVIRGKHLELTAVEFHLLNILAADPGRIYSRNQLIDKVYHDHRVVSDRTIDSHIKKLRKKIAEVLPEKELIHSVYGIGYKFDYK